nr:transposase [Arthrobacter sp. Bi26]
MPAARLDGAEREIRLLVDHREDLVAERTRVISRLRWHLHELDPAWASPANFDRASAFARIKFHLEDFSGIVADLAQRLLTHLHRLTEEIDELTAELSRRIPVIAPALLAIVGCGSLTAAKILGETAGVTRFRSKDAYARHNGTAPLPVWSSNKARHRLSRTGNRQLNAALHRIALTQARCHPGARELLARRKAGGDGGHGSTAYPQTPTIRRRIPGPDRRSQNLRSQHAHPRRLTEELETVPLVAALEWAEPDPGTGDSAMLL